MNKFTGLGLELPNLSPIKNRNRNTVSSADNIIGIDDSVDHESNARKLTEVALASGSILENRIYKHITPKFIPTTKVAGFLSVMEM